MSKITKVLLILLAAFIVIQFIRPAKNLSAAASSNDVFAQHPAQDTLKQLIQTACYDCHSNNTNYPWYSNIQPVAWWLNHHVVDGKRHLNFSEFATYTHKRADHKMEEVVEQLEKGEMPLSSYTFLHPEADLNKEQTQAIIDWAKQSRGRIMADSLSKKAE
ncbi:MAG TPA: heme-binding domain-containing protein [Daejeonella sp.]|nr:heme-binding domain-containing protein [Daejeonella sp.]